MYQFLQAVMIVSPEFMKCQSERPGHAHEALAESAQPGGELKERRECTIIGSSRADSLAAREGPVTQLQSCLQGQAGREPLTGGAVGELAAALVPAHTEAVLQEQLVRAAAGGLTPLDVDALCVAVEIRASARAGLPTWPLLLPPRAVCTGGRSYQKSKKGIMTGGNLKQGPLWLWV